MLAALVPYVGIAVVASARCRGTAAGLWLEAPMLGVVDAFSQEWLREPLRYVVAVSAVAILAGACSAAMLGLSRLGYSLALQPPDPVAHRLPAPAARDARGDHRDRRARWPSLLLLTADLEFLLGISAFGATAGVHARVPVGRAGCAAASRTATGRTGCRSTSALRGGDLPVPAALGSGDLGGRVRERARVPRRRPLGRARLDGVRRARSTSYYRLTEDKPLLKRVTVPEQVLTRKRAEAEYGSILVPVLGTALDDDIVQTAGRLAAEEDDEFVEGGAVIEALWVFEVPMALPLDSAVPDAELKRARAALARAKAVGEEYEGVEVATAVVRARRAGQAIVREAKRRGVEAIVLAAEEPSRIARRRAATAARGHARHLRGGDDALRGDKAPCRVVLTAPPAEGQDPTRVADEEVEVPSGHLPVPDR